MQSPDPQKPEVLPYGSSSSTSTLNIFQKVSVFVLRAGGSYLIGNALESVVSIMYERARGYDMSWSLAYPIVEYFVFGVLAILFAKPFGSWLGSGLGRGDHS